MLNLWTFGGLSFSQLLRRTAKESWQDAVFGQGGRLAFYHFLALFPALLIFMSFLAHIPHAHSAIGTAISHLTQQVLPSPAWELLRESAHELGAKPHAGFSFVSALAGALWAACNGTWAVIYGLNTAYEVRERRGKLRLAITIVGLTLALALTGTIALALLFCTYFLNHFSFGFRVIQWIALILTLLFSFSLLYRFAPDLRDPAWRWSTPGAVCALALWISASVGMRFYFEHVTNESHDYGHLNSVVILLLWLYVTNGAILIGGEMNSEIEKAAAGHGESGAGTRREPHPGTHEAA